MWKIESLKTKGKKVYKFVDIPNVEIDFIINEIKIEKGYGKNYSLKLNIFLMFFAIYSHIPLIVVGKPGCSKSLAVQLILRNMRGEFSDSPFLRNYPIIISTPFQGSENNTPKDIEKIFSIAKVKQGKNSISLIVFDELGLSELSPSNPLKKFYILNYK